MSNKEQYKDYARRHKQNAEKLRKIIDFQTKYVKTLKLALRQKADINIACRHEIRKLKEKISKMQFWRDLFGIKTR